MDAIALSWRKVLLLHRAAFLRAWERHFPKHDPVTLRHVGRVSKPAWRPAPTAWRDESWQQAAQHYHRTSPSPPLPPDYARRLLNRKMAVAQVWRELNRADRHPTPQATIEAIVYAVRERGIAALNEPTVNERLRGCDDAARAEIRRRIDA